MKWWTFLVLLAAFAAGWVYESARIEDLMTQPTYRLELRPLPDPANCDQMDRDRLPGWVGVPPTTRLRRALKQLVRQYGLECIRVEEIEPAEQTK